MLTITNENASKDSQEQIVKIDIGKLKNFENNFPIIT